MPLDNLFEQFIAVNPDFKGEANKILLALKRNGLKSSEELVTEYDNNSCGLMEIRGIGFSRMKIINKIINFRNSNLKE